MYSELITLCRRMTDRGSDFSFWQQAGPLSLLMRWRRHMTILGQESQDRLFGIQCMHKFTAQPRVAMIVSASPSPGLRNSALSMLPLPSESKMGHTASTAPRIACILSASWLNLKV